MEHAGPSFHYQSKNVAAALQHILGNTYRLSTTTLMYRWNVTGSDSYSLRNLFGEQHTELHKASEIIADRIRAIGFQAIPDSCENVVVPINAGQDELPNAERMVRLLLQGHDAISEAIRTALDVSRDEEDEASSSVLSNRLVAHGAQCWMLTSLLDV